MVKRMEVTTEIGIHSRITEDWRRIDTEDCFAADLDGMKLVNFVHFMDAPDGVSTCHMLEIEDEAA